MYKIKNKSTLKQLFIGLLLTICIFMPSLCKAEVLKGGVEKVWTVELARKEAFKNAKPSIDLSNYPPIDPHFVENKNLIKQNKLKSDGRSIKFFSDGWYSINYDDIFTEDYYYNAEGELQEIGFSIYAKNVYTLEDAKKYSSEELYPLTCYKHSYPSGRIIGIVLDINGDESYIFKPNGELDGHWIGNKYYDEKNQLIMTRSD